MRRHVVEEALGRLITDTDFRRLFYMDPAAACRRESLDLTAHEIEALVALNPSRLQAFARMLDARIVRASVGSAHYWSRWSSNAYGARERRRVAQAISPAGLTRGPK